MFAVVMNAGIRRDAKAFTFVYLHVLRNFVLSHVIIEPVFEPIFRFELVIDLTF